MTEAPDFGKFAAEHKSGDILSGRTVQVVPFGTFVEMVHGVTGLLYGENVAEGTDIQVEIVELDAVRQRTSLKFA
jgi:predicted RNA-binding protein with RPS1 domain